jgi:acrylyl-CoA reductase (NADPH)
MSTDGSIRAVVAAEKNGPPGRLVYLDPKDLPDEEVTIRVKYSSLNYKDGLAITGKGPVVRKFPMVCGVDLAGTVEASRAEGISPGDEVVVTGFGLGEDHFGGFADLARVKAEWAVKLPVGLDARRAMAIGTAGLTSMLCVMTLERNGVEPSRPSDLPVAVTGAAGGVGSVAVAILAGLGYNVAAVSGRPEEEGYLRTLGASSVVARADLSEAPPKALESEQYAGGVDAVGGTTLATLIRRTQYDGCVAACGNAGGVELATTVFPFILRNVTLAGVDSVRTPLYRRKVAWERLATELPVDLIESMTVERSLEDLPELAEQIVAGKIRGRVLIAVNP